MNRRSTHHQRPQEDAGPDSPTEIGGAGWRYTIRRAIRGFTADEGTDLAAALTYRAVLAVFPGLIAALSLLGLFGKQDEVLEVVMPLLAEVLGDEGSQTISPIVSSLASAPGAGLAFVLGLVVALWSASGYVAAFGRAMNRVYGVAEGRPVWKLRPLMLLVTLVVIVLVVALALMLVVSGSLAAAIGELIGLSSTAVTVWNILKWPVVLVLVVFIVALLYYATPNVKQPRFRWISLGAAVAIIVWILASVAFGFYVANFSNYASTYGALGGVIIFLLWLWITNLALLLGAEVDAEVERTRELLSGVPAEHEIQLPVRDDTKIVKDERKAREEAAEGRRLREDAAADSDATQEPEPPVPPERRE